MPESVYKVIELVGTSTESWEKAAPRPSNARAAPCATCASPRWSNRTWS